MQIQEIASNYNKEIQELEFKNDWNKANRVMMLYAQIAYDEGYRKAMRELKEERQMYSDKIQIKPRKHGLFEYVEDFKTISDIVPLIKKRMLSKRQKASFKKHKESQNQVFTEEMFMLSMALHTGFEQGYAKASSLEETVKIVCSNPDVAQMAIEMFEEMLEKEGK